MKSIEGLHSYEAGTDNPVPNRGIPFQDQGIETLLGQKICGVTSDRPSANNDNVVHHFNLCFSPWNQLRFPNCQIPTGPFIGSILSCNRGYINLISIISNGSLCQTLSLLDGLRAFPLYFLTSRSELDNMRRGHLILLMIPFLHWRNSEISIFQLLTLHNFIFYSEL